MTPTRLRECLDVIGWSQRGLADKLAVDERQARRWAAGLAPVPDAVAKWLEQIGTFHAANPAPTGRVRGNLPGSPQNAEASSAEDRPAWPGPAPGRAGQGLRIAFDSGVDAYRAGEDLDSNPYREHQPQHSEWNTGWHAADARAKG